MNANERMIELSRVCGEIKEDEYRKVDKSILKKIYTTKINFGLLMNHVTSIKGLGFARFARICEFILDNDCERYLGDFYRVFDRISMIDSSSRVRLAYRELTRDLDSHKDNIKGVLDYHKILFVNNNDIVKVNRDTFRIEGYKENEDSDTFLCPYFNIITDKGRIEKLKYSIVKNRTMIHVKERGKIETYNEPREIGVARNIIEILKDVEVWSVVCYDGLYLMDELARYYGLKKD